MKRLKFLVMGAVLVGMSGSPALLAQSPAQNPTTRSQAHTPPARNQRSAPEIRPQSFRSPDEAVLALIDAVSKNDKAALTAILGSKAQGLLSSGNTKQDEEERQAFSALASAKNHIERSAVDASAAILLIGDKDWPFPIPLIQTGQQWHFDAELGAIEMQARQVGANELDAIEICMGYVNAQQEYAAQQSGKAPPAYAQKIMSSSDGNDGLYQAQGGLKLVPEGFANAAVTSDGTNRKPYHGYLFRVLKQQGENAPGGAHKYVAGGVMIGGFALIAWPAEYGATGIHSFIVSHDGDVFEKDLGPGTATLAPQIVSYDPDKSWTPVDGTSDR
jgi:hypothetical protein